MYVDCGRLIFALSRQEFCLISTSSIDENSISLQRARCAQLIKTNIFLNLLIKDHLF